MMPRKLLSLICLFPLSVWAQQQIRGVAVDKQGEPLVGIMVKAFAENPRKMVGYAVTSSEGHYEIALPAERVATHVVLTGMGFRQVERNIGKGTTDLGRITMEETELELKEVTVKAPPVRAVGDTITYNVEQLKDKSDRTIEDVIKKIPGVEVDNLGHIKYQGEAINKFYIEGLDMLGGRYTLATQNINPDDIASVSVYENHQPKRVLQGIEYSKYAALNLTMKRSSMLRPIGTVTVGAGYGDEALWLAEGTGLFIAPRKQFLLTAKTNNTGNFYEKETTNFLNNNLYPKPIAMNLLTSAMSSNMRLSRDRYLDNRSATGSLNSIHKLKGDRTLATNAGYYFNRLGARQSQSSYYWQEGMEEIVTQEDMRNRSEQHEAWLNLRYEHNENAKYISEELNAEGSLSRLTDMVEKEIPLRQRIKTDHYAINNHINAVWHRGSRLFTMNSDVAIAQVPHGNLQAVYTQTDSAFIAQDVEGLSFRTVESTSYGWILSKHSTLTLNARLQANYDKFSADSPEAEAVYSGFTIHTGAFPTYKFQTSKLNWEVRLPLHMIDMRFSNRKTNSHFSYHRPLATLNTSLNYHANSKLRLGLEGSATRTLGGMRNFIDAPIHTTYRSTSILGVGMINENDLLSASFSTSYRNPLRGTNYTFNTQYQHGRRNYTSGSNVTSSTTENIWNKTKSNSNTWIVIAKATKNFLGHGTVLTASANLVSLRAQSLRQGKTYGLNNNTLTLSGGAHNNLLHRKLLIDVDLIYSLSTQKVEMELDNLLRNEITPSLRLSVVPVNEWEIYTRAFMNYVENEQGHYNDNFYLDSGVRYTRKRFEAEIVGKNLTNRRDYTLRRYDTFDRYTYSYKLRPIEILAIFRIKLNKE